MGPGGRQLGRAPTTNDARRACLPFHFILGALCRTRGLTRPDSPSGGHRHRSVLRRPIRARCPSIGTFAGDTGPTPAGDAAVLVQLLLGPSIDATQQRHSGPMLLRDEAVLRSRLHDLFLELVVDADQRVAFTRQVVAEDVDAPVLLRKAHSPSRDGVVLFLRATPHVGRRGRRARRGVVWRTCRPTWGVFERGANPDQARFGRRSSARSKSEEAQSRALAARRPAALRGFADAKLLFPAEERSRRSRRPTTLLEWRCAAIRGCWRRLMTMRRAPRQKDLFDDDQAACLHPVCRPRHRLPQRR